MKRQTSLWFILLLLPLLVSAQVDYYEAGRNISESLNKEAKARDNTKNDIQQYTSETISEIKRSSPVDYSQMSNSISNQYLRVKQESVNTIEMHYRLLTKGLTPVKEYRSTIESIKGDFKSYENFTARLNSKINNKPDWELKINDLLNNTRISYAYDKYTYYQIEFQYDGIAYTFLKYQILINEMLK